MCGCTGVDKPACKLRWRKRCQMACALKRVPFCPMNKAGCSAVAAFKPSARTAHHAFNASRPPLLSPRCPSVLLASPLSRPSAAERALRLAEELTKEPKKEEKSDGDATAPSSSPLAFVVVAVGTSDEGLWRRRLEGRAAALAEVGSFSARHKPRCWAEVEALRDRGRRELLLLEDEENGGERSDSTSAPPSFKERMLRELGVDRPDSLPFSRLWRAASARFVVDTAAAAGEGEEEREGRAFMKAAAGSVAAAVRGALAGERTSADDDKNSVVFLGGGR